MADLRYKVVVDDEEAKRKISELLKGSGVSANGLGDTSADSKKSTTSLNQLTDAQKKLKEAQLESIASLRKLREERSKEISDLNVLKQIESEAKTLLAEKQNQTESLIQKEKELNAQYKQGQIDLQQYNKALKDQAEERRKSAEEQKKADKVLRDAEKSRKEADRAEQLRQKNLEKNRKLLEKESSAYHQLNQALANVRKESKDVLAEMFKLEGQGKKNSAGYQELANKARGLVAQTQYLDKGIKKIDASLGLHQRNVGNYASALDNLVPIIGNVNAQLANFGTSIDDLATKPGAIKELGSSFISMGKGILAFVLSPIGLLITALGSLIWLFFKNKQAVIDFNNGLLNVGKTTGLEGRALQGLADDIIGLSRALQTVSTTKLLEYATVAGQLGVKGSQNILAFTEALAKLETASDISGEEGGSEIARLLTLTDGGVQNVKAFGDEIVNLGNNFAATENEILGNATKIAQSTGVYKVGRQEVLAFATATKSVGVEAELVGSTMGRTLGTLEKVIRSGKGLGTVLKLVGGTQADLSKRFREDASGVLIDFIGGLNRTGKSAADFNKSLEAVGITAIRDQAVLGSLASNGFEILKDALVTVKDATGAMDAEFETASGKIVNQSARIGIAWDNMVLSIENGSGAIGVASVAVVGFFAEMLEGITNVVTSKSWGEFFTRINPTNWGRGGQINDALGLKKVFDDVKKYNKEISKIGDGSNAWIRTEFSNMTKQDFEKSYKLAKEYSDKMAKASLEYEAAVLSGRLSEDKNTVNEYKKQESLARLHLSRMEQIRSAKGYDFSGKKKVSDAGISEESEKERLKRERAEAAAAKKSERLAENSRKAIERQRSLQLEIDKINEIASRNQLSRDESEVESIRDKYAKIKEEVRKFYDDPKNKGQRVDTSGLLASENFEVSEAETRFGTKKLVESLNQQKILLDEYNSFVSQTSKEEADKRYAGELKSFKGYIERLKKEYMEIIALQTTAESSTFSGSAVKLTQAQEERAKALKLMIDSYDKEEKDKQNAKYISAIQASKSFNDQVLDLERKYQEHLSSLGINASEEQKAILKKGLEDEKSAILVAQYERIANTEKMFRRLSFLGKKASLEAIAAARKVLIEQRDKGMSDRDFEERSFELDNAEATVNLDKSWIASAGALKKYREQVALYGKDSDQAKKSQKDMFTALAVDLQNASAIIGDVSGLLGSLGASEGTQQTVNQIGQLVGGMSELAMGIASGNPVAVITGSIKTLTSVIDIFNTKDKKIQKQIDAYKDQLESLGKAYDRLQKQISNSVGESYYSDSDRAISNLKEQQRLLEGMAKSEEDKKKTDKDKVKGYYNEIDSINNQIEEIQKSITENLVQTTFKDLSNSLADALVNAFEAGENAIDALDETFDKFIKNALVNSLKLKMIEPIINEMVGQLADYMKSNDNSLNGFDFTIWKDKVDSAGKGFTSALEEAYKQLGLSKDGFSSGGGLKSSIAREVTEASISENSGLVRSQTELLKRSFDESKAQGITMVKQLAVALDQLTALNSIQVNTGETVKRLDTAVSELQSINKNLGGRF